jgi:hypothetical protein
MNLRSPEEWEEALKIERTPEKLRSLILERVNEKMRDERQ